MSVIIESERPKSQIPPGLNSLHLVSILDLNRKYLDERHFPLMEILEGLESTGDLSEILPRRTFKAALIQEEPSTRTLTSAELGLKSMGVHTSKINASESSMEKREIRKDTRMALEATKVAAIGWRFKQVNGVYEVATPDALLSIINFGNGSDQHPTQGTGDFALMRILRQMHEHEDIDGATYVFGRQVDTRVINSVVLGLATHYHNIHVIFAAPDALQVKQDVRDILDTRKETNGFTYELTSDFKGAASQATGGVYLGRVRMEDFDGDTNLQGETRADRLDYAKKIYSLDDFIITEDILNLMPDGSYVLNALPNDGEIPDHLKKHPMIKAYTRQMTSGMYSRMAHFLDRMSPRTVDLLLEKHRLAFSIRSRSNTDARRLSVTEVKYNGINGNSDAQIRLANP